MGLVLRVSITEGAWAAEQSEAALQEQTQTTSKTGFGCYGRPMCSTPIIRVEKEELTSEVTWEDPGGNSGGQGVRGAEQEGKTPFTDTLCAFRLDTHKTSFWTMNTEQTYPWCHLHKAMKYALSPSRGSTVSSPYCPPHP